MRRLSIIDVKSGHQPLANENQDIWIVFNGEIYNHAELRARLEARGHRYRTHSDTETIVHLYEEYGRDCVKHLRGMFAFAIWDRRKRVLFAARDRLGHQAFLLPLGRQRLSVRLRDQGHPCLSGNRRRNSIAARSSEYLAFGYITGRGDDVRGNPQADARTHPGTG